MRINYNVTGADRKALVRAMVELLGEQYRKICPELYASFAQLISDEQFLKGLGL